jgi:hypothetical protein
MPQLHEFPVRMYIMLGAGLLLFILSFFLHAVGAVVGGDSMLGYQCAGGALLVPWTEVGRSVLHKSPLTYMAVLFSGLINPLLIVTMILGSRERFRQLFAILRNILLGMVPFCWIVFFYGKAYPREGHLLWLVGMALMLFSFVQWDDQDVAQQPPDC